MSLAAPTNNFLLPNATFFVELIAFAITLGVLWKFVVTPLQQVLGQRQELIRAQAEEVRRAQEGVASAEAGRRETLEGARGDAAGIRDEARTRGKQVITDAQTRAQAESDRVVAGGRQQLASERDGLARELRGDIGRLAVDLAGRIVGEPLGDRVHRGTVDSFLRDVRVVDGRLVAEPGHATSVGEPA